MVSVNGLLSAPTVDCRLLSRFGESESRNLKAMINNVIYAAKLWSTYKFLLKVGLLVIQIIIF